MKKFKILACYQQSISSGETLIKRGNINDGMYILQIKGLRIIQQKLIIGRAK
jgi:hypothetical protein